MIFEQIAARLALPSPFLNRLAETASHRYKEYTIPKRRGGRRTIHHPARELKLVQRWLLQNVLVNLPVHAVATAYRKGSSIRQNAEMHVANNYILRIDFQDFFPSLKGSDVVAILKSHQQILSQSEVTDEDIEFMRRIVCRHGVLTIGAPTSPLLSNAIMFEFDETWSRRANAAQITYTRYADDLYFSTNQPNVLRDILEGVQKYLDGGKVPALSINKQKTAFSSRKRRRLSTGLVLTSDRKVSIGRDKKRMLKSLVQKLKHGNLQAEQVASLRGWIAHLGSVEPMFVDALRRKYNLDFDAESTWAI